MLDMDGTLLDLAYDNFMWLEYIPAEYARQNAIEEVEAPEFLSTKTRLLEGKLEWYCLDHWSDYLDLDVAQLHRDENHRIGYLPGAEDFLRAVRTQDIRVLMVTNSHKETLTIKDEMTGITGHFDGIYTSHAFGHPKESQEFWQALAREENFDPSTTLFIDDTASVLRSAAEYGIEMLLEVTNPDTTAEARESAEYPAVGGVSELLK